MTSEARASILGAAFRMRVSATKTIFSKEVAEADDADKSEPRGFEGASSEPPKAREGVDLHDPPPRAVSDSRRRGL